MSIGRYMDTLLPKITPPKLAHVYPRDRLFQALDRARRGPVIWLSGPPGAGKTTLVASYLRARKLHHLWYRLDEGDADIASFVHVLGQAGAQLGKRADVSLPHLTPEYLPHGLLPFARKFFRVLYGRLRGSYTLVLDNYQDIPLSSDLHRVIREGLEELPPRITVILLSRGTPPPELAPLQRAKKMTTVDPRALQLTPGETHEIAKLTLGRSSASTMARSLHEQTQGWAAGLTLLLEQLQACPDKPRALTGLSHEAIFAYLAEELFARQGPEAQTLLLQTAILPTVTREVATNLTGIARAGEILAAFHRNNLFTERGQSGEVTLYRYHDLFRAFLLNHGRQVLGQAEQAALRAKGAALLANTGQADVAMDLLLEAGRWARASRLLKERASEVMAQGRAETLFRWLSALPVRLRQRDPWLAYWFAACRMPHAPQESLRIFDASYRQFRRQGNRAGTHVTLTGAVTAIFHEARDFHQFDRWFDRVRQLRMRGERAPSTGPQEHLAAHIFYAMFYRQPDASDFAQWRSRIQRLYAKSPDPELRLLCGHYLMSYYTWMGDFSRAGRILERLGSPGQSEAAPLNSILCRVIEATMSMYALDSPRCLTAVKDGLALAQQSGVHLWDSQLMGMKIALHLSRGELAAARETLAEMGTVLAESTHRFSQSLYHVLIAWEAWLRGDLSVAHRFGTRCVEEALRLGAVFPVAVGNYAMAWIHHERGEPSHGAARWKAGWRASLRLGSPLLCYMGLVARARFALDRGDEYTGRRALRRAFMLGRRKGIANCFLWHPSAMAQLCARALALGIETEYAQHLIRGRDMKLDKPPHAIEAWPWRLKVYTLGRFKILVDGRALGWAGKAPKRPLELLKALIAFGGTKVQETQLTDALWPEAEGDAAHKACSVTLARLRRLLGVDGAIRYTEGALTLDPELCWVDVWAFERLLDEGMNAAMNGHAEQVGAEAVRTLEQAIALYAGPFLGQEAEAEWIFPARKRWQRKAVHAVATLARHDERREQWEQAATWYRRGLAIDEASDTCARRLARCLTHLGQHGEGQLPLQERQR